MMDTITQIKPFSITTGCAKCGAGEEPPHSDPPTQNFPFPVTSLVGSSISLPAAPPHFVYAPIRTLYCPGGKDPETEEQNPVAAMFKMATGSLPEQLKTLNEKKINICAGIYHEHLHRICSNCGYEFLMECKDVQQ